MGQKTTNIIEVFHFSNKDIILYVAYPDTKVCYRAGRLTENGYSNDKELMDIKNNRGCLNERIKESFKSKMLVLAEGEFDRFFEGYKMIKTGNLS